MSLKALQSMVESGLGIGVMPAAIVTPPPHNTLIKTINHLNLKLPVGIATLPEKSIPGLTLDSLTQTIRNEIKSA